MARCCACDMELKTVEMDSELVILDCPICLAVEADAATDEFGEVVELEDPFIIGDYNDSDWKIDSPNYAYEGMNL